MTQARRESFPDTVVLEKLSISQQNKLTQQSKHETEKGAQLMLASEKSIFFTASNEEGDASEILKNEDTSNRIDNTNKNEELPQDRESPRREGSYANRNEFISNRPESGKKRLTRGYNIFVSRAELDFIVHRWEDKPTEIVRRLMNLIVGTENLKKMTPTGKSGTSSIPKDVFNAIFIYVNRKVKEENQLTKQGYLRVCTAMCNTLRNPKKKI